MTATLPWRKVKAYGRSRAAAPRGRAPWRIGRQTGRDRLLVTLREILELPALRGTRLYGAPATASREVRWLATVHIRPARPQQLRSGELLLLPPPTVAHASLGGGWASVVRQLQALEPAALAVWEPLQAETRGALDDSGLPWLAIPAHASPAFIEREATRYIADCQAELQRLEATAYRELLELVIHGRGTQTLLLALARLTGKAVALQDADQQVLGLEWPMSEGAEPIAASLAARGPELLNGSGAASVRLWLKGLPISATDPPTAIFDVDDTTWVRLVAPVQGAAGLGGLLSVLAPRGQITARDRLLLKRATAACALEFAKQTAVHDAREQPRGEFVAALLAGDLGAPAMMEHRAARLGYTLGSAHNVLLLRPAASGADGPADDAADRRLEELIAWQLGADAAFPFRAEGGTCAIVLPLERFGDNRLLDDWAADFHRRLGADGGLRALSASLGRLQPGLAGIREAVQGARWALDLGEQLFGPGHLTRLQDLGVYQLLLAMRQHTSLGEFCQEMLGPLVDYDRLKRADLVRTLDTYFVARNSPSEAAERLHLHRNTVLYRLRRIRELLSRDPDDPEQRLALQLALRARHVLDR
jgi:PucR family transcriptional regulator, purine catabolism regulatory protein